MNHIDTVMPSDKVFGYFFSFVFGVACLYFALKALLVWAVLLGVLAVSLMLLTSLSPSSLHALNSLWFKSGLLLGKIISPIVLGLIFFAIITPVGICMRLAGRDELRLKMASRTTYWKTRSPVGPEPHTFKNQF